MTTKLTPAQVRVLRELCAPNAFAEGRGSYWYIFTSAGCQRETRAVMALSKAGLLNRLPFARSIVNTAGRALLAEIDAPEPHACALCAETATLFCKCEWCRDPEWTGGEPGGRWLCAGHQG